jgi:hypothetical protein
MKRLYVALCVTLVTLSAANAESVLRTMVTTDIRGLMSGNSLDDNTGPVLQTSSKAWSRRRSSILGSSASDHASRFDFVSNVP